MQSRLQRITRELIDSGSRPFRFNVSDIRLLMDETQKIIAQEPSLLEIESPCIVVGDIHGQFTDLLKVFDIGGNPLEIRYLFLGDYVDRGPKSLEVICLLFALKIQYPDKIYLLRGNHESAEMTEFFGFAEECRRKATTQIWMRFCEVFEYLPIACTISSKIFCVHGGLCPDLNSIEQIRGLKKPIVIPETGLIADLVWSDPSPQIEYWGPNERGDTISWGYKAAEDFMKKNSIDMIIRGHQLAFSGYNFPFKGNRAVVTVFTASKYAGEYKNDAAVAIIDQNLKARFEVLSSKQPVVTEVPKTPRHSRKSRGKFRNSK